MLTDNKNGDAVAGVADPGSENGSPAKTLVSDRGYNLPNSGKVYVAGKLHPDIRVPSFVVPSGVEGSLAISMNV